MADTQTAPAETNGTNGTTNGAHDLGFGKKHILINAFDMSTVGHLSPGQWKASGIPNPYRAQLTARRTPKTSQPRNASSSTG